MSDCLDAIFFRDIEFFLHTHFSYKINFKKTIYTFIRRLKKYDACKTWLLKFNKKFG